jgi:CheY-like chemotaxis protein
MPEGADVATNKTILVVDDEQLVRVLVRRILVEQGFRVLEAESGADALRVLEQSLDNVDLLLTDLRMPGMHGTELARNARALLPDLPVLYMSGFSDEATVLQPEEFIQKPFQRTSMMAKVNAMFAKAASPSRRPVRSEADGPSTVIRPRFDQTVSMLMHAEWELARKRN